MGQFWQIFACPEFIEWVSEFIIILFSYSLLLRQLADQAGL